jgi:hypothetical protein
MRRSRNPRAFRVPALSGNCDSCKFFATVRKAAYCMKRDERLRSMEPCKDFTILEHLKDTANERD